MNVRHGRAMALLLIFWSIGTVGGAFVMSNNEELKTAVYAWCTDPTAAEAHYGHISTVSELSVAVDFAPVHVFSLLIPHSFLRSCVPSSVCSPPSRPFALLLSYVGWLSSSSGTRNS